MPVHLFPLWVMRQHQQRGIIRRRPRAGYLELTDDARFSLAPEPPDPDGPLSL